jgi:hypothetical protein
MKELVGLDRTAFCRLFQAQVDILEYTEEISDENTEIKLMRTRAGHAIVKMIKTFGQQYNEALNMAAYVSPFGNNWDGEVYYFSNGTICLMKDKTRLSRLLFEAAPFKPAMKIQKLIDEDAKKPSLAEEMRAAEEARLTAVQKREARKGKTGKYAFSIGSLRQSYPIVNLQLQLKLYGKEKAKKMFPATNTMKKLELLNAVRPQLEVIYKKYNQEHVSDPSHNYSYNAFEKARTLLNPFSDMIQGISNDYDKIYGSYWTRMTYFPEDKLQKFIETSVCSTAGVDAANAKRVWKKWTPYTWAKDCIREQGEELANSYEDDPVWSFFRFCDGAQIVERYQQLIKTIKYSSSKFPKEIKDFLIEQGYLPA